MLLDDNTIAKDQGQHFSSALDLILEPLGSDILIGTTLEFSNVGR